MTLEELSRPPPCVREIKDEKEGTWPRDLLQALVHSKRKLVSLKNSTKRQNTWKAEKASWGHMLLHDSRWHQWSLHTFTAYSKISLNCTFSFWTLNLDICYKSKPVDFLLCWKMYLEEGMSEALFVWSMWDLAFHMLLKLLLHWFTLRSCFRTLEEVCSNFMAFLRHYRLCSWFLPDLLVLQPFVSGQSNA